MYYGIAEQLFSLRELGPYHFVSPQTCAVYIALVCRISFWSKNAHVLLSECLYMAVWKWIRWFLWLFYSAFLHSNHKTWIRACTQKEEESMPTALSLLFLSLSLSFTFKILMDVYCLNSCMVWIKFSFLIDGVCCVSMISIRDFPFRFTWEHFLIYLDTYSTLTA